MFSSSAIPAPSSAARALMEPSASPAEPSLTAVLTKALAAGDEAAFRAFHAQYFDRLLRYHLVLARGDEQAARDALQETLIRVARKTRVFSDEVAFWSWLTVVARNVAIDGSRRRRRYWTLLSSYALGWFRETASRPDRTDGRLRELLEAELIALNPEDRALIETKYLEGASVRELADANGMSEKSIEARLLRLRRKLRQNILRQLRHESID
jgi:RNA polymerase sigma-70 factor (ECF subfamily)